MLILPSSSTGKGRCILWLLCVGFGLACRPTPPPQEVIATGSVMRWIEEDPVELFDLESLYEHPVLESWPLDRASEQKFWKLEPAGSQAKSRNRGVVISGEARTLSREVNLVAAEVFQLEVEIEGLARGHLRLAWRRSDESPEGAPAADRWIPMTGSAGRGTDGKSYRFPLVGHQDWRGNIERLWLSVQPASGETAVVQQAQVVKRQLQVSALKDLVAKPLKVELDHEVRDALVAIPGGGVERFVEVPEGAELRWSYGLESEARETVEFIVSVEQEEGTRSVLWQRKLDPQEGEAGRWFRAREGLGSWAGQRVRLLLETRGESVWEEWTGLPFWAHPAVQEKEPSEPPLNVLFISVDTLRADHLSLYGYPRPTSPHLEAWAQQSATVFERTVAASPWTLPSHMSMLTGLDAVRHGVNHDVGRGTAASGAEAGFVDFLPDILRRAGYRTAAITGGAYLHPRYGFTRGFEQYRYWPDRGRARGELKNGVDRSLKFLEQHRRAPFFLFLHTYAVHDPYIARRPFFERVAPQGMEVQPGEIALWSPKFEAQEGFRQINRFLWRHRGEKRFLGDEDIPLIAAFYDSGIAHMDAEIGRLLAGLEKLGLREKTIVVLTSDHGEALGQGGYAGHVDLIDDVALVPLVISWPGLTEGGQRVEEQVRSIDIPATLLEGLGLASRTALDGVSLLQSLQGQPLEVPPEAWTYAAASNRGLALRYHDRYKLIVGNSVWPPRGDALYDLQQDPEERTPLAVGDGPGIELRKGLERYFDNHAVGLRLRLVNGGSGTLRGEMEGAMVRPVATKSVDLLCPCLEWREMGKAAFEVPPGESYTLHFEKIFGQRLRLRGALESEDGRRRFDHTFTINKLEGESTLRLEGRRWQVGDGEVSEGGTGFHVWWRGSQREHGVAPAEQDPELRRQLEALGYL